MSHTLRTSIFLLRKSRKVPTVVGLPIPNLDGSYTLLGSPIDNRVKEESHDRHALSFHLNMDKQYPSIELFVPKLLSGSPEKSKMSLLYYAEDIAQDAEGYAAVSLDWRFDTIRTIGSTNVLESLQEMSAYNQLMELRIGLSPRPRPWNGVTLPQFQEMVNRKSHQSKEYDTETRDTLVKTMAISDEVSFFYCATDEAFEKWKGMIKYLRDLFTYCQHRENLWFFRDQCELAGLDRDSIIDVRYPKVNFKVHRSQVTHWQCDVELDNAAGNKVYSKPVAYKWKPFRAHIKSGNPDEVAFMIKLGIAEERNRSVGDFKELIGAGNRWFRGVF
ncbi:hypothetical protein EJ04DRAFT_559890 [Polyplosphaeria fusca]|uniref:Uncharacterized protein n=1 Tax=Polyplosphaeria fusca TaxID=682080 RepID=A0A9P4RAQ1_9PLEO|nr:hypothetical protein EJ04DRAFT_559890 [Polyplosphaeria fusca]